MMDRRAFLKSGGIALFTLGAGPSFLARVARASAAPKPFEHHKILVTIFQRGAMDALMAIPPLGGKGLAKLRPRLAMSAARSTGDETLIDLGVGFGLHPAFEPMHGLWREGRLAVVHGVGSPDPTRSHFDAQDYMASGTPGRKGTRDGWLNRVVGELGHEGTPFRAIAMSKAMPRSLYGPQPALAVEDLSRFEISLPKAPSSTAATAGRGFEALYEQANDELLRDTAQGTFEAIEAMERLDLRRYRPRAGSSYPRSPLGNALRQIAVLVKAEVGLEVAFAESGGWDTHVQQGTVRGSFARSASDLAGSIAAFHHDLGQRASDVLVMTMTEFGRTVRENGSGGTDHGHGSCLFLIGDEVDGGKVHGKVPELLERNLYEGRDLPVTTDFRAVFAGIARDHLGVDPAKELFPGWSDAPSALMRG